MKRHLVQTSYWELLLGIAIIAFQLCAWPTDPHQARLFDQPRHRSIRQSGGDHENTSQGWLESTTASELLSISDPNLKTS